jgi:DNA-binding LacI/PurR family transcriptional regulator
LIQNAVKENCMEKNPEESGIPGTTSHKTRNTPVSAGARPTSADVARAAGVSRTQVSYVLNNTGAEHVSDEKRQRIMQAARELGYLPHISAQTLRRGYSNEFAIFFPAPYPPRINEILGTIHEQGLAEGCVPTQYSFNSYTNPERKLEAFRLLLASRPRGLFCGLLDIGMEEINLARAKGIEHILVLDVERHADIPTLYIPAERVGFMAAEHLLSLGHRHLGILCPSDPIQKRPFELRYKGFKRAAAQYRNVDIRILKWPQENLRPTLRFAEDFSSALLAERGLTTALYTYSDDYALPLMTVLQDRGIRIPEDLCLIGTDNLPYGAMVRPALSTIKLDKIPLGERAVAMMNRLLTGAEKGAMEDDEPTPELIARASTATIASLLGH